MYRLFIVEDDKALAGAIAQQAEKWDLEVKTATDFRDVMHEFSDFSPHIVLIDISLPFFSGFYWCSMIRKVTNVPIVFISSASDNMNIIMAVNMGADDFIAKPFDATVLIAKIQALLRRSYALSSSLPVVEARGAILDMGDNTLLYSGEKIELTKNEYRILLCLMEQKGKTVSREMLMQRLWESEQFVDENTLTVNINRLRKKLQAKGLDNFISTRFGVGYIIE